MTGRGAEVGLQPEDGADELSWASRLARPTLAKKIAVLLLVPLLGMLSTIWLFVGFLDATRDDAVFVNLAGRQRMLSERLQAYAHMVWSGQDEDREELRRLASRFTRALETLEHGGLHDELVLSPAPAAVLPALEQVRQAWSGLKPSYLLVASGLPGDPDVAAAFARIRAAGESLTALSDAVVTAYAAWSRDQRRRVLSGLLWAAGITLVFLVLAVLLTRRFIVRPIRMTAEASRRILAGDWSHRVSAVTRDELATLAVSFNAMSDEVSRLVGELDEQAQQWRTTFDAIAEPVFLHDADNRLLRVNSAAVRQAGAEKESEVIGRPYHDVLGLAARPLASCQHLAETRTKEIEAWTDPRTGSLFVIESHVVTGADGRYRGAVHVHRDVTEQRRADEALRASEAYNRAIVDNAGDAIITIDARGVIESWNTAAQSIFGYSAGEIIGRNVSILMPEPHRSSHATYLQRHLDTGEKKILGRRVEVAGLHKSGASIPLDFLVNELVVADGVRFTAIARNLTEQKRNDARIKELHHQLVEASRLAGMADVATGILHNVGNILNSVGVTITLCEEQLRSSEIGTVGRVADLLREHRDDLATFLTGDPKGRRLPDFLQALGGQLSEERDYLLEEVAALRKNVDHIKIIVGTHQDYARASGVRETVALSEIAADAMEMNAASCAHNGIRIIRSYEEVPPFPIDRHKILQILINLLSNARHAVRDSAADGGEISVRIASTGAGTVLVAVRDDGVGISEERMRRIFEQGYTTKEFGHGYGLHTSANAAREMGGTLKAHSDGPGRGATFTLELPVGSAEGI